MTAPVQAPAPAPASPKEQARLALWGRVKHDYQQALGIARLSWPKDTPLEVLQSAAATILIHYLKLHGLVQRSQPRGGQPHTQAMAPSSCPDCGKEMYDNRGDKKGPRSPDFRCKDPECNKAVWLTPPPKGGKKKKPAPAPVGGSSYDDFPEALEDDDDLPF